MKYNDNQQARKEIAGRLFIQSTWHIGAGEFKYAMVAINSHFESVQGMTISELCDKQEAVLEAYEATDDPRERYVLETMDLILGTMRQELQRVAGKYGKG